MRAVLTVLAALLASACTAALPSTPPQAISADPFYTRHIDAGGIPILSSDRVDPRALVAARDMVMDMFSHRPDLRRYLAAQDYRIAIIGLEEALLDLPENRDWTKPPPDDPRLTRCERKLYDERIGSLTTREYWDNRARAIGGKRMVGSEEDILGFLASRYFGETIFVHELGHSVLFAIEGVDPALYAQVEAAYANALQTGLWKDEYTSTTIQEYWAEGTQFWFESNRLQSFGGRRILGHEDLAAYDPMLYAALREAYGRNHRLKSDPFYLHPDRVPRGEVPENTAEVC